METLSQTTIDQFFEQIVVSLFDSMLQVPVIPVTASWPPAHELYTAAVTFGGAEPKQVQLHLSLEQALILTGRLMPIPQPAAMTEDVYDAMREIVNMIGGNMKAVIAPGSQLSIAFVLSGNSEIPANRSVSHYAFEGESGPFWVSLLEGTSCLTAVEHEAQIQE